MQPNARTVLVTGATGFIGRALVEQLLDRGDDVVIMHRGKGTVFGGQVREIACDRNDPAAVAPALKDTRFDVVWSAECMEHNPHWAATITNMVRLLRPGSITLGQLRGVVGEVLIGGDKAAPRVPGSSAAHYAPSTPLTIVPGGELDALAGSLSEGGQRIAVLAQRLPLKTYETVTWINAGKRAEAFGHDLYANLRTLDKAGCARILVQEVPGDERWDAIRDRLARAAVGAAADSGRYSSLGTGVLP